MSTDLPAATPESATHCAAPITFDPVRPYTILASGPPPDTDGHATAVSDERTTLQLLQHLLEAGAHQCLTDDPTGNDRRESARVLMTAARTVKWAADDVLARNGITLATALAHVTAGRKLL